MPNEYERSQLFYVKIWRWFTKRCIHDWEVVKSISSESIAQKHPAVKQAKSKHTDLYRTVEIKLDSGEILKRTIYILNQSVNNRVCLKCGKCDNNSEWFRKQVFKDINDQIFQLKEKDTRKDRAKKSWREKGEK